MINSFPDIDEDNCYHIVIFQEKRFYGTYPRYIKGVCTKCLSNFKKYFINGVEYTEKIMK